MQPRRLGSSGLLASPIGLNAVSFTAGCAPVDPVEASMIVSEMLGAAAALVDATDLTGSGEVEVLVGRALRGRRDRVVLASRGGARYTVHGRLAAVEGRPTTVAESCEQTLRRLGTDHLDLYYLDRVDPAVPLEESMGALATLVTAGKVRHLGLSHVDSGQLRRAHAVHPVAVVSARYSLLCRRVEMEMLPTARSLGIGLAAYRPLGSGLLTDSLTSLDRLGRDDYRRADPHFRPENFDRIRTVVAAAGRLASRRHLSIARLALTWVLAQGSDIVTLPGTRSLTHLEMNLTAADLRLAASDLEQLASLLDLSRPAGPGPEATG